MVDRLKEHRGHKELTPTSDGLGIFDHVCGKRLNPKHKNDFAKHINCPKHKTGLVKWTHTQEKEQKRQKDMLGMSKFKFERDTTEMK